MLRNNDARRVSGHPNQNLLDRLCSTGRGANTNQLFGRQPAERGGRRRCHGARSMRGRAAGGGVRGCRRELGDARLGGDAPEAARIDALADRLERNLFGVREKVDG